MLQQMNVKGFLGWVSITVFASLMVMGAAATASADSDHTGKMKAMETCENGEGVVTKNIVEVDITAFKIIPGPFPGFNLEVTFKDIDKFPNIFTGSGVAVTKNSKVKEFHAQVTDNGDFNIHLTGKLQVDHKVEGGDVLRTNGKLYAVHLNSVCIWAGKFKTKIVKVPPPG